MKEPIQRGNSEKLPFGGQLKILKLLLERGADINARDEQGLTALDWAAMMVELETVEYLISKGGITFYPENWDKYSGLIIRARIKEESLEEPHIPQDREWWEEPLIPEESAYLSWKRKAMPLP